MRRYKPLPALAALWVTLLTVPELCLAAVNEGSAALAVFINNHIIEEALIAVAGMAGAFMFYYAFRLIVTAYNEQATSEIINSFIYVFTGFVVIGLSLAFENAFVGSGTAPLTTAGNPFNPSILNPGITSIANFILKGAEGAFTLTIVIVGLRMVTAQGDEAAFDKWRKILIESCIGVMLMLIAQSILIAVQTPDDPGAIVAEIAGIGLFLLTIIGFTCILALVIAGVLLITSIDESQRDRAKRAVIGTLLALLIVIVAYTLIVTFVL
ncbi:hypothetical protein EXS65_04165 [Candidatus Peribacteria bacterium]|nr:hypothetical protein [Candidatus Peribacteria bacterium]